VLVAVDERCPDFTDAMGEAACKRRLNTDGTGYAVLGAGLGLMLGFAIPFGIGESKQAKARKRSTAWWQRIGPQRALARQDPLGTLRPSARP
jgi:hypothetical protein